MTHYVGAIRAQRQQAPDGRVLARGRDMDNARGLKFWAIREGAPVLCLFSAGPRRISLGCCLPVSRLMVDTVSVDA